jgi:hypothetical protein
MEPVGVRRGRSVPGGSRQEKGQERIADTENMRELHSYPQSPTQRELANYLMEPGDKVHLGGVGGKIGGIYDIPEDCKLLTIEGHGVTVEIAIPESRWDALHKWLGSNDHGQFTLS